MSQSMKNFSLYINFRFLIALLVTVSLSGCGMSSLPEADFNASEGRCYSMTPLLQILPQSPQLGRLAEVERGCLIDHVWVSYVEDESPGSPTFYIIASVLDGESPYVRDFTPDRTAEISGPTFPKRAITSTGNSAISSFENCQQHAVEFGSARRMKDFSVVTEEAGHQVCIRASTFNGKISGDLSFLPRPDIMIDIRYSRESDRQAYDTDDIAELMLPLVSELNIPTQDWPSPANSK